MPDSDPYTPPAAKADRPTDRRSSPVLVNGIVTFLLGFLAGSVVLPGIQWLAYGAADPFSHGWPLLLEATGFLAAVFMAWRMPCPIASVPGLYSGLIAVMLVFGNAEYPAMSMIALAVHGLVPAVLGCVLGLRLRWLANSRAMS